MNTYEITVEETWHNTFRVKANSMNEAQDILEDAFNCDNATCDDGSGEYTREQVDWQEVDENEYVNTSQSDIVYEKEEEEE